MDRHNARVANWGSEGDPDWRGDCAHCGWLARSGRAASKRAARTEEQARRQAERHNATAAERDREMHRRLYGPR